MNQTFQNNAHCSYCNYPFDADQSWPRRCAHCDNTTFRNPISVIVVLIPVDNRLLLTGHQPYSVADIESFVSKYHHKSLGLDKSLIH